MFRLLFPSLLLTFFFFFFSLQNRGVSSHEESGEWSCESDPDTRLLAQFRPGVVTLDGHADDWNHIDALHFPLLPALDPDPENAYEPGKMTLKALHDGNDLFFLLQVDGDYVYSQGNSNKCASVALMFQIGQDATYHKMGGCKEGTETCTNKTCKGHEVDIMHFSVGNAIPGRLYGGNPIDNREGNGGDRFGHLVDLYAWNPHCRYLDGIGPQGNDSSAQNNWKGAWWHSSLKVHSGYVEEDGPYATNGQKGTYFFEFSRPLRTMDRLRQDVQFVVGGSSKMSAAFWYPVDGNPWHGSGHYSISCDWTPLDISSSNSRPLNSATGGSSQSATGAFAVLFSAVSLCVSIFVGYKMVQISRTKGVSFTPMDNL